MKMRPEDFKLAVYFIAKANWQDEKWYDQWQRKEVIIKRGEIIGSVQKWSKDANMTYKQTRTALKRLALTRFLLILTPECVKRAKGYTHISVPNYEFYQDITNYLCPDGQSAGEGRAKDGRRTGNNRNIKEDEASKQKEEDVIARSKTASGETVKLSKLQKCKLALDGIEKSKRDLFPSVDFAEEWRKIQVWERKYPKRFAKRRDFNKFCLNWLGIAEETAKQKGASDARRGGQWDKLAFHGEGTEEYGKTDK